MNKKIVILLVAFIAAGISVKAQDYKTALGVRLSTAGAVVNNSITFKYFLNEKSALEAQFAFGDPTALGVLYEVHKPLQNTEGLKWYYGGGGYIGFSKPDPLVGAQGVVGLDYKFTNLPLNLSLDWKPELNIAPEINFEPSALGLSIRFTFNSR